MYVYMHRMRVPLRRTSVPMLELGLVGAAPISCSRMYLIVLFTLAFRNACIRKLFVIVFGDLVFVNFECSLFAFYWFLLSFCCFTSLQLLGLCSDVDHHFLQGVMSRRSVRKQRGSNGNSGIYSRGISTAGVWLRYLLALVPPAAGAPLSGSSTR